MDLKNIQEFVALAEIRNYARTADKLFMTQATLSRHIMGLETELGQPLFTRTSRKVELTEFGLSFLPYAKMIAQIYDEWEAFQHAESCLQKNCIVLGAPNAILKDKTLNLESAIADYLVNNHSCTLEILQDNDDDSLLEKLRHRECDIIIRREAVGISDSFQRINICQPQPLYVILPITHPFAKAKYVLLDFLQDEYFIVPPSFTCPHKLFVERCRQIGFEPKLRSLPYGQGMAVKMMKEGLGIPLVSHLEETMASDLDIVYAQIYPPINMVANIIFPKLSPLSPTVTKLLESITKFYNPAQNLIFKARFP